MQIKNTRHMVNTTNLIILTSFRNISLENDYKPGKDNVIKVRSRGKIHWQKSLQIEKEFQC